MKDIESNSKVVANFLKIMANENRLIICCKLMEGETCVSELAEALPGISQPAVSQHLNIMKKNGIVGSRKYGQQVRYFLSNEKVIEFMKLLRSMYSCE